MSILNSPRWLCVLQFGLGVIIVILSLIVLLHPIIGFLSIILLLVVLVFIVGIEMIISHIFTQHRSHFVDTSLGIAVIILAIISVGFPLITSIIVISLLGIALLLSGISKIIHGINEKFNKNWRREISVAVGALSIILAIMIFIFPVLGIAFAGFLIRLALLITGSQMIVIEIMGRMEAVNNTQDLR